jgi:hypothetical protein
MPTPQPPEIAIRALKQIAEGESEPWRRRNMEAVKIAQEALDLLSTQDSQEQGRQRFAEGSRPGGVCVSALCENPVTHRAKWPSMSKTADGWAYFCNECAERVADPVTTIESLPAPSQEQGLREALDALTGGEVIHVVADALMATYRDNEVGLRRRPADEFGEAAIESNPATAKAAATRAVREAAVNLEGRFLPAPDSQGEA